MKCRRAQTKPFHSSLHQSPFVSHTSTSSKSCSLQPGHPGHCYPSNAELNLCVFSPKIHSSVTQFLKDLGSLKNSIYFLKYYTHQFHRQIVSDTFLPKCHLLQYTFTWHTDNPMLHLLSELIFHLYHLNNTECHVCFTNCQLRLPKYTVFFLSP